MTIRTEAFLFVRSHSELPPVKRNITLHKNEADQPCMLLIPRVGRIRKTQYFAVVACVLKDVGFGATRGPGSLLRSAVDIPQGAGQRPMADCQLRFGDGCATLQQSGAAGVFEGMK